MKTYVVEKRTHEGYEVLEYSHTLDYAKAFITRLKYTSGVSILMIEGLYFGEGFHKYRLVPVHKISGLKWKRFKHDLDQY